MSGPDETRETSRPGASEVPGFLTGLRRTLLVVLGIAAVAILVGGLVAGAWNVALAAVPFAVFAWAVTKSIEARYQAKYLVLSDAGRLGENVRASQPSFNRAALWAAVGLVSLGIAAALIQAG